jgi:methionyl aminopeptidase
MIRIKTAEELDRMRASNRIAALVRDRVAARVAPGVTTAELDAYAAELIAAAGAQSAFRGYRGYPGHICVSVNEEVVHGLPGPRRIQVGDIVALDIGVASGGFVGDTATTVMVGVSDPAVIRLVSATAQALDAAIAAARAGARLSDISHAVERTATAAGFSVVREFVGHGIGRQMHEEPQIPNFGPPGRGPRLRPGMTLAIEPMVNLGGPDVTVLTDGWTVVTRDRKPSAHFEHTVAIGEDGPEILTRAAG